MLIEFVGNAYRVCRQRISSLLVTALGSPSLSYISSLSTTDIEFVGNLNELQVDTSVDTSIQ